MNTKRNPVKRWRWQFSLAGLMLLLTVSSIVIFVVTRPPPIPLHEGTITIDGKPLQGATVEFIAAKTSKSTTDEKGHYSLNSDEVLLRKFETLVSYLSVLGIIIIVLILKLIHSVHRLRQELRANKREPPNNE